ncbi:MAG: DNA repair protein RecO [Acidobacteriia bacterium]|nr:DNA repair protein RecO [Terriglobia bacterium]
MPLVNAEGLILRTLPLSESDLIAVLFTREHGKIRVVAKGARRLKSRFGGSLGPMNRVRVSYYEKENRELLYLNSCELLESAFALQSDYELQTVCAYFTEVVDVFFLEREANAPLFRLVAVILKSAALNPGVMRLLAYFNFWVLRLSGLLPGLAVCAVCGKGLLPTGGCATGASFAVWCPGCRPQEGLLLGPGAIRLAAACANKSIENLDSEGPFQEGDFSQLNAVLEKWVAKGADRKLQSLEALRALRRTSELTAS